MALEAGFLSRSKSDDSTDTRRTASSSASQSPVKVVTRLRPLREGERKQAVFPDWSSAKDWHEEGEDGDEEGSIQSNNNNNNNGHHFFPKTPSPGKKTNEPSGIALPSASRIPKLSRSRWNRPKTKGIPTSLIVESSQLSPGPSHTSARSFSYDAVLTEDESQTRVYQQTVGNAVRRNLFRGYNTTICAYGQVGSGKSYTMFGPPRAEDDDINETVESCLEETSSSMLDDDGEPFEAVKQEDGIMLRAMKDVFDAIAEFSEKEVTLEMTFMEIYRDELRDLLVDRSNLPLQLYDRHHEQGNVVVHGLRSIPIYSLEQACRLVRIAQSRRATASSLHHVSSRSHGICTLHVTISPTSNVGSPSSPAAAVIAGATNKSSKLSPGLRAKLTLVDLAGSERLLHTPTNNRNKSNGEAITINKDLFVLGKVVAALASYPVGHVPYRDSKLTRILRDSLGGNCCTVFIACVSTAEINLEESLHTLRYAERARAITHTVRKNVLQSPISAHDASFLRAENQRLQARLNQYEVGVQMTEFSSLQSKLVRAEQEAQRAREHAKSVRRTADKWKEQFEKIKVARAKIKLLSTPSVSEAGDDSSSRVLEVPVTVPVPDVKIFQGSTGVHDDMDDDLDALLGDSSQPKDADELSDILGDGSEAKRAIDPSLNIPQGAVDEITKEMKGLANEKAKLAEQVADLNQLLADQRLKMVALEEDYNFRQSEMTCHIAKQEKQRDQLDGEVDRLKQKVHLLASDLKQESVPSISAVFRGDAGAPSTPNRNELEMQTWRMETNSESNAEAARGVGELRQQLKIKEVECRDLQETVDKLTEENLKLHEENDRLRMDLQHEKENNQRTRKFSADVSLGSGSPPTVGGADNDMFISNLNDMMKQGVCIYELSPLATNSEQIEFYLPKLRVFCPCGKHSVAEDSEKLDPTAITSILRPWQLEFLATVGITHTLHLLQGARHRSSEIAKKMRKWRGKKKLPTFHTAPCAVAVHIWSRTCIRVLKAVHQQKVHGKTKPVLPDFMEFKLDPDLYTLASASQLSHRTGNLSSEDDTAKSSNRVLFGVPE
uniref:Kinesin motor domain-containing protein n=1 Tax=Amphora coffeiformis TaxID=265554 RepID=A0A7S3P8Y7_9STRA